MKIPLRAGRVLDAHDNADSARAVLINEAFAHRRFAGRSPIGHRLRFGQAEGDWYTIVGIVGDVRQSALDLTAPDAVYVPAAQWHWVDTVMTLVVRSGIGAPLALAPALRQAIWSVDGDVPFSRIATMDTLVGRAIADRRFALILFEAFGLAALILVSIGIYGVLAGSVAERTREIGVRSALGAAPRAIVAFVVRDGLAAIGGGAVAGILGMAAATRLLTALLFGISPLDPVTYVGVVVLLLGACAIACWAPARRAASIDPSVALRVD
jgi:putative ABC transport system permease protein